MTQRRVVPDTLEVACGTMIGFDLDVAPLDRDEHDGRSFVSALSDALLGHLQGGPCFVAFSGGRDSSGILALAVSLARRHGLPLPVPITERYEGVDDADEREWQELVIGHLAIDDWEVISTTGDSDLLSDSARSFVHAQGLLYPANTYLNIDLAAAARGGTLLTGIGGDELFESPANPVLQMWKYWHRPGRRHVRALSLLKPGAEQRRFAQLVLDRAHWLTPTAVDQVLERLMADRKSPRWDTGLRTWVTDRYYGGLMTALASLGAHTGSVVAAPILERRVLAAAASQQGAGGFESRTQAMEQTFGHVLPPEVSARQSKAVFDAVVRSDTTSAFAANWDGSGIATDVVDVDRLLRAVAEPPVPAGASLLLQQAAFGVDVPAPGEFKRAPRDPSPLARRGPASTR